MTKSGTTMIGLASLVALVLLVPATAAHPWGGHQKDECEGLAPVLAACTTGAHFRFADEPVFTHGFTGIAANYTGTVESTLSYLGGERVFRCDYDGGALVAGSCAGSGAFPPPQSYFVQVCKSYALGTTTPGGMGGWGCFMEHG